jgi:dolichol-phosphate mannosyltransferase
MKVSIIIPTKDEPLINELIEEIHHTLRNEDHEIIVVDKSNVMPKIKNAKLIRQKSDGLGKAVLEGLKHVSGDVVVLMDGDFSHRPEDIPKLLEKINDYDIVIGSRFVEGGRTKDPKHRKIVSFVMRKFASIILGLNVKDSMSGFSAVKKEVYESLNLNPIGYKINLEILFKGKKKGFKIIEVPIIFERRRAGKSKAGLTISGLKEVVRIIRYVFELKFGLR